MHAKHVQVLLKAVQTVQLANMEAAKHVYPAMKLAKHVLGVQLLLVLHVILINFLMLINAYLNAQVINMLIHKKNVYYVMIHAQLVLIMRIMCFGILS